jgi:hypothetical protein
MAIKGKKKSQRRGSQARRRPATAPRPVIPTGRRVPWYRTAALIADRAADNERLERRQAGLDDYADRLKGVVQTMSETASQMTQAPSAPEDPRVEELGKDAQEWITSLGKAQVEASKVTPVEGVETAHQLVAEAIGAYINAANAYQLVPSTTDEARADQLINASGQRDLAGRLLQTAINELDTALTAADMNPSGIAPPAPAAPIAPGAPAPGAAGEQGGGSAGAGGSKGGGKGED